MKTQLLVAILPLMSVNCAGCTNQSTEHVQHVDQLTNSTWRLAAFENTDTTIAVEVADTILLSFQDDRVIHGKSNGLCGNDYYGTYFLGEAATIHFVSLFTSKALCPRSMYWEYYKKLHTVTSFKLENSRLYLNTVDTRERLVFERRP